MYADQPPSLLQLEFSGSFRGAAFIIRSGLIVASSDARWNEWFAVFDDGRIACLTEAAGLYSLSFMLEHQDALPDRDAAAVLESGDELELAGGRYAVDQIMRVTVEEVRGNPPHPAASGDIRLRVECVGERGAVALLEYAAAWSSAYAGSAVSLEKLGILRSAAE